jgi:hypothetical protein
MIIWDHKIKEKADQHAEFITGLLKTTQGVTIETCEYLCKTVFFHAYKHCQEDVATPRGANGKFIKKG